MRGCAVDVCECGIFVSLFIYMYICIYVCACDCHAASDKLQQ